MNHAYPWDFMLDLSRRAGLTWMRDWSAKWHTVEPAPGTWDFTTVDPQIDPVTVFHMIRLAETIGSIADHAENAGDMMRAMMAR